MGDLDRTGNVDAQGRVHDHEDPEYMGRIGCVACDQRLEVMGVPRVYDHLPGTSLVSTRWRVHEWVQSRNAFGKDDPPHFYDSDPDRRQVKVIWDEDRITPLAVQDDDGCQALIEKRIPISD